MFKARLAIKSDLIILSFKNSFIKVENSEKNDFLKLLQPRRHGPRETGRRGETDSEFRAGGTSARRKLFFHYF